jgi:hypothetical protein
MVQLPVHNPIVFPSVLAGRQNGRLPVSLLWPTPGQAGGPTVRLVEPAARGWRAMCAAARTAGHILKVTSSADSYRSYEQQVATWTARYEPDNFPGSISSRVWPDHYDEQGRFVAAHRWYQKPDTAVAAYPGSSNHGWGLAADIGEESDGDAGIESLDDATLNWLIANAHLFGFSAEIQSEKWHWRRYSGDVIEPAIVAYEQGVDDMTPEQDATLKRIDGRVTTMLYDLDKNQWQGNENNALKAHLVAQDTKLDAILAAIAEIGSSAPEVAVILAGMQTKLDEQTAALEAELRDAVADGLEGGSAAVRADA